MKDKCFKFYLVIFLFISYTSHTAFAEDDIEEYVKVALENRKAVQIAREQISLARLRVLSSARILGPSINLEYRESDGETIEDPYKARSYGLGVEQSIFMGGKKYYTLKRELKALDIAKNNYLKVEQDIKLEVVKACYRVLLNQERLRNFNELLIETSGEFEMSEKKYRAKIITEIDYSEMNNLEKEMLLGKEIAEGELAMSKLELKQKSGIELDEDIYLTEKLLNFDDSDLAYSLAEFKEIALENNPEINSLESLVLQTKYNEKVAKSDRWPTVSMEGSVGRSGEAYVADDLVLATEWAVFANLRWQFWGSSLGLRYGERRTVPEEILDVSIRTESRERSVKLAVLDRVDYFFHKKEKEIVHQISKSDLEEIQEQVIMKVEKSYNNFKNYRNLAELAEKKLKLGEKKIMIIEKRKLLDEVTSEEVIKEKNNMVHQKNSFVESIYKLNIAKVELKRVCGIDIYPE